MASASLPRNAPSSFGASSERSPRGSTEDLASVFGSVATSSTRLAERSRSRASRTVARLSLSTSRSGWKRAAVQPSKLVFVIDDDKDIREAIHDLLAIEGYGTAEARDGSTALAYLRSHPPPGVILLDWNMAPMNGAAFMSELSHDAALSPIPVVVLTADVRVEGAARAQGLSSVIMKPIDVDQLLEVARRHCHVDK